MGARQTEADAARPATPSVPGIGYASPLKAVREDRFQETAAAAKAQLEDAYDG